MNFSTVGAGGVPSVVPSPLVPSPQRVTSAAATPVDPPQAPAVAAPQAPVVAGSVGVGKGQDAIDSLLDEMPPRERQFIMQRLSALPPAAEPVAEEGGVTSDIKVTVSMPDGWTRNFVLEREYSPSTLYG